jgi:hypothetical protein
MAKQGHLFFALTQVSKALDELPPDRRAEYLRSIGVARETIDEGAAKLAETKAVLEATQSELDAARAEIERARAAAAKDSEEWRRNLQAAEAKTKILTEKLADAQREFGAVNRANVETVMWSTIQGSGTFLPFSTVGTTLLDPSFGGAGLPPTAPGYGPFQVWTQCAKCGTPIPEPVDSPLTSRSGARCKLCYKESCASCWGGLPAGTSVKGRPCPACHAKQPA